MRGAARGAGRRSLWLTQNRNLDNGDDVPLTGRGALINTPYGWCAITGAQVDVSVGSEHSGTEDVGQ